MRSQLHYPTRYGRGRAPATRQPRAADSGDVLLRDAEVARLTRREREVAR